MSLKLYMCEYQYHTACVRVRRESVLNAPPPAFYSHALLKPYVFFDVASGREQRQAGGGSLRNQARLLCRSSLVGNQYIRKGGRRSNQADGAEVGQA